MTRPKKYIKEKVEGYDEKAEAAGWLGVSEIAFGMMYRHVLPGQSILDIGIGTGLGSVLFQKAGLRVFGMDLSREMLDACRSKGITDLARHDLLSMPYPYGSESMDHAVCIGVLNFFNDLSPVFGEVVRILRKGGMFVFTVGDRVGNETPEIVVGAELTKTSGPVTMYRHSAGQIEEWADKNEFTLPQSLPFTGYMDRERTRTLRIRIFLARKGAAKESV